MKDRYLKPVKQTFAFLIVAVLFAAANVKDGFWNKTTMDVYLRTCAVGQTVRDYIWKNTKSRINRVGDDETATDEEEVSDGYEPIPSHHTIAPMIWYSELVMNSFVDCGMHLVFHGVVAYCMEVLEEFITDHKVHPSFLSIANKYITQVEELRLDWCKAKCLLKQKWIAENELGLTRIFPFIFGLFFNNVKIPKSKNTSKHTIEGAKQMIHTLHVLVCYLMSPRDPNAKEIDLRVKLFFILL